MLKAIINGVEKDIVRIPMIGDGPATVTGTNSVTFETDATSVIDYTIKGKLQQSGTPSPSSPIYPSETGDRTENLFAGFDIIGKVPTINGGGLIDSQYGATTSFIPITDGDIVLSAQCEIGNKVNIYIFLYDKMNVLIGTSVSNGSTTGNIAISGDSISGYAHAVKARIRIDNPNSTIHNIMLNLGSTALPYEPYGKYKLPITCGTTQNIYLQEPIRKIGDYVDVVSLSIGGVNRRITKFVFSGKENIAMPVESSFQFQNLSNRYVSTDCFCTHYQNIDWDKITQQDGISLRSPNADRVRIRDARFNTADAFKQWLSDQYQNGTPVTAWFVSSATTTETATIPTIITTKGQNTLSIGTTLSPSSTEVTYLGIKNTYKEGWEIRDQQDRLIWGKNNTLTGVSSISFRGYGVPLKSIKIVGNTQQNGTPSPDAPIMPEFVGEKTGNLWDGIIGVDNKILAETGWTSTNNLYALSEYIPVEPNTSYTYHFYHNIAENRSTYSIAEYDSNKNVILPLTLQWITENRDYNINFTTQANTAYIRINWKKPYDEDLTLNLGSTPLPYEPYGYKIPITNAGQTTPVYLGQVRTTRRVRKLVLDGTENWQLGSGATPYPYIARADMPNAYIANSPLFCTHFVNGGTGMINGSSYALLTNYTGIATSIATWKSWLQQQYANGTPVTVWYVLATPENAIVNEPLAKIGDYADELHSTDAGVTIPTIEGSNTLSIDTTLHPSNIEITGHIKSYTVYVMTYIDYTDMTKSYTIGDVNKVNAFTQRRRCNMLDDGTITAFYGDPTFIEDGSNGQVMVYQPKFYYKVEPVLLDGIKIRKCKYYISDYQLPGYKLHPAFIDRTDPNNLKEFPFVCIGAYEGCLQNGDTYITDDSASSTSYKLSSIAFTDTATNGVKPSSGVISPFGTIGNYETTASNRGTGWHIENIWITSMNQLMFVIEMCNPNSQTALGSGVTNIPDTPNTANNASLAGSTSSLGNGSGRATTTYSNYNGTTTAQTAADKTAVSYRGMENPFGNIWKWVDGMTIKNTSATEHTPYICKSFAYTRNSTLTNYDMVNVTIPGDGYVTAFGYDPNFDWLFISAETNSSNTGSIRDYLYTKNSGYTCAFLGGCWNRGANAGLFCWSLASSSGNRTRNISARICYLPQ